jgi:RNA polymerase sigma factor (sigma-70 family)
MLCVVTGNRHEAEELAQDAFLALWERWDRVGAIADPSGYLHRTAMNAFRKRYRRTRVAARKAFGLAPAQDAYEAVDARSLLAQALGTLGPRQRAAIVLTELLDHSAEEAASILGIRASTVRALSFQARKALRLRGEFADG